MSFSSSYWGGDSFAPSALSIFFSIISFAIFFAIAGSIVTIIFTWIYNLLAAVVGGIKLDLNTSSDNIFYREDNQDFSRDIVVDETNE